VSLAYSRFVHCMTGQAEDHGRADAQGAGLCVGGKGAHSQGASSYVHPHPCTQRMRIMAVCVRHPRIRPFSLTHDVARPLTDLQVDGQVELHLRGELCLGEEGGEQQVHVTTLQVLSKVKDHPLHLPQVRHRGQGTLPAGLLDQDLPSIATHVVLVLLARHSASAFSLLWGPVAHRTNSS
jgi:hypothetical protein